MNQFRQAFFISQVGTWPNEIFVIAPSTQFIDPNLGFLPIDNNVFYLNNTLNKIDNAFLPIGTKPIGINSLNGYSFIDSQVGLNDQGFLQLDFNPNSYLIWDVGSVRKNFNTGPLYNMNQIDVKPGANFDSKDYFGYLIFPTRICLRPERLTFSGGNWVLSTRTVVRTASTFFTYSSTMDLVPYDVYQRFTSRPPVTAVVPAGYTLTYDLCASRTQTLRPVIDFTSTYNPEYVSIILEPPNCRIRPDSTAVFYNVEYYSISPDDFLSEAIDLSFDPPIFLNANSPFRTSYLFNYDPYKDPTRQYFQLIQRIPPNINTFRLSESGFSVLSAVFDFNTSNFRYFSNFFLKREGTIFTPVNTLTGIEGTSIALNYIVDCPTIQLTNEPAKTGASISGAANTFGVPVATGPALISNTFSTKYPPHFYSYRVSVSSSTLLPKPEYLETDILSFYLTTSAISGTTTSVTLSTFIASDFNFLTYDLGTTSPNDLIKYTAVESDPVFLSALNCFYGLNQNLSYNIFNSPWVPLVSAKMFSISYPTIEYGEISFALKATVSSVNGFLDNKIIRPITLALGLPPADPRPPFTINIVDEGEDFIEVDASFINAEQFYPYRDLTDSVISWTISPTSQYTSINSIDVDENPIQFIPYLSAILFNETTWTVRVSGFGPQPTVITLSSQKYNITTSVTSNSGLFNFFAENRFLVGPAIPLNNLNATRTIRLTAAVPYKDRVYEIPLNTSMNWAWTYDNLTLAEEQPIEAFYVGQSGTFTLGEQGLSQNISALNFNITPAFANLFPNVHRVNITAYSFANIPPIEGSYGFDVDDFPDPSIFNTDFTTAYINGLQPIIADTRKGINVVTRAVSSSNSFTLTGNRDILPTIVVPSNGSIVWSVSNNVAGLVSTNSFASGIDVFFRLNLATGTIRRENLVSLSAINCIAPGWTSAHSVQANTTFYMLPAREFTTPLAFNLYPTYIWQGGPYLTLLDNANYTLATAPTAYANKISNTQTYAVSTSFPNLFNRYLFEANNTIFSILSSSTGILDIPYYPNIYSNNGLTVSITAYGKEFPQILGTTYVDAFNRTWTYPNYGQTLNFNTILPGRLQQRSPKVIPYDNLSLTFTPVFTSIDLDNNRFISVIQTISSNNNPTEQIPSLGTVTYILSTNNWTSEATVPAINGLQNVYFLNVGDPYTEGNVSGTSVNTIYIKASASIPVKIQPTTFNAYDNTQYQENRDLWGTVEQSISANAQWTTIVAYSTSTNPEIYLSDYYTTTGNRVLVQFSTPDPINLSPTTTVSTYFVNFGEEETFMVMPSGFYYYQFNRVGTFYAAYSAVYLNGFVRSFNLNIPVIVKSSWPEYNQEDVRILDETRLTLPYSIDDVEIQPNEWGDLDIFNTAMSRIYDNLEYLKNNSRTINTDAPTIYYGWLGANQNLLSQGIRWFTQTYGNNYYLNAAAATGAINCNNPRPNCKQPTSFFSQINGLAASSDHIFVLDGLRIRALSSGYIPVEARFTNMSQITALFVTPKSLAIDETGLKLYTVDLSKNQVFKFDVDITSSVSYLNVSNAIGGFGYRQDYNKFNAPSEVVYNSNNIFVLDFNNYCVKHYNADLNWLYTYYSTVFDTTRPIAIVAHPAQLLYVLTDDYKLHIFEYFKPEPIQTLILPELEALMVGARLFSPNVKLILDEPGEFLYIVTSSQIFKYTATGYFLTILNIPDSSSINGFTDATVAPNRNVLFSTLNSIIKTQDILEIFKIGEGLPTHYWSKDQILVKRQEMAQDTVYNRALKRMAQNMKTFRDNMNSKFVIKTEITDIGAISYFTLEPIAANSLPVLDTDVENETLFVGVNELHIPQSINKELIKLYNSLNILSDILTVTNTGSDTTEGCPEAFCWSWKATSCYNLKLPLIRVCGINPITYDELKFNFPVNYAPSKIWGRATSDCCKDFT
jgi:hypothetical protein